MEANLLKINDDKTEVLFLGSNVGPSQSLPNVVIGNSIIQPATSVRNLGVVMDSTLSCDSHITSICRSARFHLYRLRSVKKYLTSEAMKLSVHALVTFRLDFSNSLLYGLTARLPDYSL